MFYFNTIKNRIYITKIFNVALLALPFLLVGCNSNNNNKDEYEIYDLISLSDIEDINYYQYGYATSTIFQTNEDNYNSVLSKFSNLKLKEVSDNDNENDKVHLEFITSKYKQNEFILLMSEDCVFLSLNDNDVSKIYSTTISKDFYTKTKEYLDSTFTILC